MTNDAHLRVVRAGPLVSYQDSGRQAMMRFGVPRSGPMDRLAHGAANTVLGNDPNATAIEVSTGGLELACLTGSVTLAVVGGGFDVEHLGTVRPSWTVLTVRPGDTLSIQAGRRGSWTYLAFAGTLATPTWLGHTATHSTSGLGGGLLAAGRTIEVTGARLELAREGEVPEPGFLNATGTARVVLGPQEQHFDPASVSTFVESDYRLSSAYDRMGVRLDGPPLLLGDVFSIPSEPIVRGSVQVAGDGVPTVLFADHQTTGGYPKIATVISTDLDHLTQLRPGDPIRFTPTTPTEAISIARAHAQGCSDYLAAIARPGRTLAHRLMSENLIYGAGDLGGDADDVELDGEVRRA